MTEGKLRVAVVQMRSVLDFSENLKKIDELLASLDSSTYDVVFLPECFYSISDGLAPTPHLVHIDNEHFNNIQELVKKYNKYFIGGSVAYDGGEGKVLNRALNFSPDGSLINHYDKVNLFNCDLNKGKSIDEADIYTSGNDPQIVEVNGFKIGMAICFDLRFPSFLLNYYREKVDALIFPAAFTVPTGKAHWHVLLRARAIESQSFVIASGQVGTNNERIKTYGHSLVVNPWGEIQMDLEEKEVAQVIELDKSEITKIRSRIKMDH